MYAGLSRDMLELIVGELAMLQGEVYCLLREAAFKRLKFLLSWRSDDRRRRCG